jgi:uncharacterized lipoprotein YbaY
MPQSRRIQGQIAFPSNAVGGIAARITVELRDVSTQDQASALLAGESMNDVPIGPNCRVAFEFEAPSVAFGRSLAMRVQVDMQQGQRHAAGDYLSTVSTSVPIAGDVQGLLVPVTRL